MIARSLRSDTRYSMQVHKDAKRALRNDRKQEQKELREYEVEGLEEHTRRNVSVETE
jgi:hypothetical protein